MDALVEWWIQISLAVKSFFSLDSISLNNYYRFIRGPAKNTNFHSALCKLNLLKVIIGRAVPPTTVDATSYHRSDSAHS